MTDSEAADCIDAFIRGDFAGLINGNTGVKLGDAIAHAAKRLRETQWVSVDKTMPPCEFQGLNTGQNFSIVCVFGVGGHDIAMYYENKGFVFNGIDCGSNCGQELHDLKSNGVTHWMPLPPAPEKNQ